jgi:hypothetical protein
MKYLLYNCFLFLIVIIFAYFNSMHNIEKFTPRIREFYRPYIRKARNIGGGFYNITTTNMSNLFRKFGIM